MNIRHVISTVRYIKRPEGEVQHAALRFGVMPVYGGDRLRRSRQFTSAPAKTCAQSHADHFCEKSRISLIIVSNESAELFTI